MIFGKFEVLCSLETPVLRIAFLPYRENSILNDNLFTLNHLYSFFAVLNLP